MKIFHTVIAILLVLLVTKTALAETVLITGANKGIGFAFAEQYAAKGWDVIATARKPQSADALQALAKRYPGKIRIEQLDVTDHSMIDALAKKYEGQPIDLLLNNAGMTGTMKQELFGKIDYQLLQREFSVNALGPLKMAEAFLPHVRASETKKIVAVSSSMGSIEQAFGFMYGYRASKTALNMFYKNLSMEMKKKKVIVALVNPGQTRTDLMKEVPGELKPPEAAAAELIAIIDQLTLADNGKFYEYDGSIIPW